MLNGKNAPVIAANAIAMIVCMLSPPTFSQEPRPNVVMIVVDDMRFDEFGAGGHPYLRTPNIDALAAQGTVFTNAYHVTPLCSPNRASLLTGQFPSRHGVTDNTSRSHASHRLATFAIELQASGYQTAHIGKWHMGNDPTPRPGYDYWVSFAGQGRIIDPELYEDDRMHTVEGYVTDLLTDRAVAFIEQADDQPFLLYLGHKAIHPDLTQLDDGTVDLARGSRFIPAARHGDHYDGLSIERAPNYGFSAADAAQKPVLAQALDIRNSAAIQAQFGSLIDPGTSDDSIRKRAQMMLAIDESTGRILSALDATGHLENTIVILTSDNGYFFGEHGLSIERRLPYEAALRNPLIVRRPEDNSRGRTLDGLVLSIDIAPTILELAGVAIPETVQGLSMAPLLNGTSDEIRETAYMEYYSHENPMPWTVDLDYRVVRRGDLKYIYWLRFPQQPELYDLAADPWEMQNLAGNPEYAGVIAELHTDMRTHAVEALGL